MPLISLGHKYPSSTAASSESEPESRIDYPSIYLRGDQVPEELPSGKFYAVVEMRVAGMRDPSNSERSLDLEMLAMSAPVPKAAAMKLVGETYDEDKDEGESFTDERAIKSFRSSMKKVIKEQIGQAG